MVAHPEDGPPLERPREAARWAASPAHGQPMTGSAPGGVEHDMPARARIIAPSLLLPAEIVLFELKPSLWYAVFVSLPAVCVGLAMLAVGVTLEDLGESGRHWAIVAGMWVIGLRFGIALLEWLGRTYVLTDRRVLMQHGVFNVTVECLGLEEITNTFVAQAAGQRLLGIGTIFFRCGGRGESCRAAMAWDHLRQPHEVHAHVVAQIDRWKRSLAMTKM